MRQANNHFTFRLFTSFSTLRLTTAKVLKLFILVILIDDKKLAMQQTEQLRHEYALVAGCLEADLKDLKACLVGQERTNEI